jgi:hypothetical protein
LWKSRVADQSTLNVKTTTTIVARLLRVPQRKLVERQRYLLQCVCDGFAVRARRTANVPLVVVRAIHELCALNALDVGPRVRAAAVRAGKDVVERCSHISAVIDPLNIANAHKLRRVSVVDPIPLAFQLAAPKRGHGR